METIKRLFSFLKMINKDVYILSYKIDNGNDYKTKTEFFNDFVEFYLKYLKLKFSKNVKELLVVYR